MEYKKSAGIFLILALIVISGCVQNAKTVKKGDTVSVDYWGTLDNGTQFDTSQGKEPLKFAAGSGQMIKGFDDAVMGMKEGETKTVKIGAKDAYGIWNESLVQLVPIKMLGGLNVTPGMSLLAGGQKVKVLNVTNTTVLIDFNHELAGKDLTFRINMLKIE